MLGPRAEPVLEATRGRPAPGTHLHEVVDGLQVGQVVVVDVHADAEVEAGVASVNDLEVPELRVERRSVTGAPGPSVLGRVGPEHSSFLSRPLRSCCAWLCAGAQ